MGILDDVFGLNNASNTGNAAAQGGLLDALTAAQNATTLNTQYGTANQALNTGATNATSAVNQGYGNATGALTGYSGQAQGTLQNGVNAAVGTDQSSNANYQPYATSGTQANGMLDNALGLNGASGNAAATSAFQAAPGYQYTLDQATGAAQRAAAAGGMNASGNTLQAIAQLGGNLANQGYQQYIANLQNQGTQGLTAAQGVSGNNQAAGSAQLTGGTTGAGLLEQTGGGLGTLDAAQGTNLGNIQTNLGSSLSSNDVGLGGALANNAWTATTGINAGNMTAAQAQDKAQNANAGILSNALGSFFSPEISAASKGASGLLSSATGGFL